MESSGGRCENRQRVGKEKAMFPLHNRATRLGDSWTRREWLRLGALGAAGLALPQLLRAEARRPAGAAGRRGTATACILLYLQGGQSQLETFDMKPAAPAGVRGEFRPIRTTVPGTLLCEHLPRLARLAHRFALLRSMSHRLSNHNPAGYYALTGAVPLSGDAFDVRPRPEDHPNPGAVAARLGPGRRAALPFVQLSRPVVGDLGIPMPGLGAGFLGPSCDPLAVTADPNRARLEVEGLGPPADVPARRWGQRRSLLRAVDGALASLRERPEVERLDRLGQRAWDLVTSGEARRAFALEREPAAVRDRYGRHTPGQSLLLARRLVEAGVRLVTVYWGGALNSPDDYWDTHQGNIPKQRNRLLPQLDQCLSALLEDLDRRGLLATTLVLSMSEFGRTPRLGQATGDNGTDATGRDHWPHCYSILLAGGGIRGGAVVGSSDRHAAYPAGRPTAPEDVLASLYDALGIRGDAELTDRLGRPLPLTRGEVVRELFG
jgi:hypothetical protein